MATKRKERAEHDATQYAQRLHGLLGALQERALDYVVRPKAMETARQWLARANIDPDDQNSTELVAAALTLALDLALFTPSMSGNTAIDRFVRQNRSAEHEEAAALSTLQQSRFRLLKIRSREKDGLSWIDDIATGECLLVFDRHLPIQTAGYEFATRLCPLENGILVPFGPLTSLDEEALQTVMPFVRPNKGLSNPERCAAALYRHVVRHGTHHFGSWSEKPEGALDSMWDSYDDDLDRLARALSQLPSDVDIPAENVAMARKLASEECLIEALISSIAAGRSERRALAQAYRRIAAIQVDTIHRREISSIGDWAGRLDHLALMIDHGVAGGTYPLDMRHLFDDLRRQLAVPANVSGSAKDELARVINRIRGLRAKTVDQGCSESEALASANKVAELLDRFGLSLSEIDFGQQRCEGIGIDSRRRKRTAVDHCIPVVATFCDCRVWIEETASGTMRYVFFGLPADVEAAHYLYDLVHVTFAAETARFKARNVYCAVHAAEQRKAADSFNFGLSRGICEKLNNLKSARTAALQNSSGRDLIPLKASVIDDEMARLGLSFETKPRCNRKRVLLDAFEAGKTIGRQFKVNEEIEAATF
jgi:Protein of unknown function (DUF2786)